MMMMILIEPDELHDSCKHSRKGSHHDCKREMTKNAELRFNGVGRDA